MKEKGLKNPNLVYITVGSGGSGFGERRAATKPASGNFGRQRPVGVVGLGSGQIGFGWVCRVAWIGRWLGEP